MYSNNSNTETVYINGPQPPPILTSVNLTSGQFFLPFTQPSTNSSKPIVGYKYSTNGVDYILINSTKSPLSIPPLPQGKSTVTLKSFNGLDSDVSNSKIYSYTKVAGKANKNP